jgi:hypothetical protein
MAISSLDPSGIDFITPVPPTLEMVSGSPDIVDPEMGRGK